MAASVKSPRLSALLLTAARRLEAGDEAQQEAPGALERKRKRQRLRSIVVEELPCDVR